MSKESYYDYDSYEETLQGQWWFAWTLTDAVLQMILGSISTLSSIFILYIIYRSAVQLKSTYHKIMAMFSIFDICFSVALALSTIPVPKSMVPYAGPALGTNGTCIAQGIFIVGGGSGALTSPLILSWYYVLTAFRVSTWAIKKYFEPFAFLFVVCSSIVPVILHLNAGIINIRHWSTYCGISPIPSICWNEDAWISGAVDPNQCIWPTDPNHPFNYYNKSMQFNLALILSNIAIAMAVIIIVVFLNERKRINKEQEGHEEGPGEDRALDNDDESDDRFQQTRSIARQAILYILAFLLTFAFVIIPWDENVPEYMDILESILLPLGGFWNMLIFVHIKIIHIREARSDIDTDFKAFMILLKDTDSIPEMVLSGMENVQIAERSPEIFEDNAENEELISEEPSSRFVSNPSAYDGLSRVTPGPGSKGLSAASQLYPTDNERVYEHYQDVTARTIIRVLEQNNASSSSSSNGDKVSSSSSYKASISSGDKASKSSDDDRVSSNLSTNAGSSSGNDNKQPVYRHYAAVAEKFHIRVGLLSNASTPPHRPSSVVDDLSSTGLSMGGPSYGGLSNEMPPISENQDDDM